MDTFKTTAKIAKDGALTLRGLPFAEGIEVEVTVRVGPEETIRLELDPNDLSRPALDNPNKGTVLRYERPFDSAFTDEELDMLDNGIPF
jgi:hypothetical protein